MSISVYEGFHFLRNCIKMMVVFFFRISVPTQQSQEASTVDLIPFPRPWFKATQYANPWSAKRHIHPPCCPTPTEKSLQGARMETIPSISLNQTNTCLLSRLSGSVRTNNSHQKDLYKNMCVWRRWWWWWWLFGGVATSTTVFVIWAEDARLNSLERSWGTFLVIAGDQIHSVLMRAKGRSRNPFTAPPLPINCLEVFERKWTEERSWAFQLIKMTFLSDTCFVSEVWYSL